MLNLAAQGKPASHPHDQDMEGATLSAFGALMASGTITLAGYEGLLFYGKALLNEAVRQMRTPRFAESLALV